MWKLSILLLFWTASVSANPASLIAKSIKESGLGLSVEEIKSGPMPGIYTVQMTGGRVLYASDDGQYFIQGSIHHFNDGQMVNITVAQEKEGISKAIKKIPLNTMVSFKASEPQTEITVFTDTSCPFCHRLHEHIDELNDEGITVRYLAYPRQGLESEAYNTMVSVWCSGNRQKALSEAIEHDDVKPENCANPIKDQYLLGQLIGVKGTPTIIFQDGSVVSGYRKPDAIIEAALARKH